MKLTALLGERFKKAPSDCVVESQALMVRGGRKWTAATDRRSCALL